MATRASNADAAAGKPLSTPPNLLTIARELRQQILSEVFQGHIQKDLIECVLFCASDDELRRCNRNPSSIIRQAQHLILALPELQDDIIFAEQKTLQSFDGKLEALTEIAKEVILADHRRDGAGYFGGDTIQIYMRMGGELKPGRTGKENLNAMEIWQREKFDSAFNNLQPPELRDLDRMYEH
ncbi:hypothetical protein FKW77_008025 [Venturia effusa]|uniref:Uncharacterized protein n=1 Tax=Venturia effusa TaxID=50376 RepID=A0A517LG75_9PEZI|nr:hypothetical protein FKW77_008025 [Venturia effusa]